MLSPPPPTRPRSQPQGLLVKPSSVSACFFFHTEGWSYASFEGNSLLCNQTPLFHNHSTLTMAHPLHSQTEVMGGRGASWSSGVCEMHNCVMWVLKFVRTRPENQTRILQTTLATTARNSSAIPLANEAFQDPIRLLYKPQTKFTDVWLEASHIFPPWECLQAKLQNKKYPFMLACRAKNDATRVFFYASAVLMGIDVNNLQRERSDGHIWFGENVMQMLKYCKTP